MLLVDVLSVMFTFKGAFGATDEIVTGLDVLISDSPEALEA